MNAYQRSRQFIRLLCFYGRSQYQEGDEIHRQEPWLLELTASDLDLLTEGEVEPYLSKLWLATIMHGYLEIQGNATKVTSKLVREVAEIQHRQGVMRLIAEAMFEDAPLNPNPSSNRDE